MSAFRELATPLAKAVAVFVSTNVDDLVILSVLFADARLRARAIVAGQFLGIAVLTHVICEEARRCWPSRASRSPTAATT